MSDSEEVPPADSASLTSAAAESMIELVADDLARKILMLTARSRTVNELADALDVPTSTTYRKVGELSDVGLLRATNPDARPNEPTRFRRTVREISVQLESDLEITVIPDWGDPDPQEN